jgi:hypothetical protein
MADNGFGDLVNPNLLAAIPASQSRLMDMPPQPHRQL